MKQSKLTLESLLNRAFRSDFLGRQRGLRVEDIKRYFDAGGRPGDRTAHNQTLLHHAADNGDVEVIEFLVNHGAEVDARGAHGYTPLHLAVDLDCNTATRDGVRATELPVTALLIRLGADPDVADDAGETPRDVARAYGESELKLFEALITPSPGFP